MPLVDEPEVVIRLDVEGVFQNHRAYPAGERYFGIKCDYVWHYRDVSVVPDGVITCLVCLGES